MAPKSGQLLMNPKTLQDIGSTIVSDTAQLALNLHLFGQQTKAVLDDEEGNNLPACLQDDFMNYEQYRKSELEEISRNRMQVGQLLSMSSSLRDFQYQLSQIQFASINIYKIANDYGQSSEIVPEHLRIPDGFNDSK